MLESKVQLLLGYYSTLQNFVSQFTRLQNLQYFIQKFTSYWTRAQFSQTINQGFFLGLS